MRTGPLSAKSRQNLCSSAEQPLQGNGRNREDNGRVPLGRQDPSQPALAETSKPPHGKSQESFWL